MTVSSFIISMDRHFSWRPPAAALALVLLLGLDAPANAQCFSPRDGYTQCNGNPATFPFGGAVYNSTPNAPDYKLSVFGLTGNIQPQQNYAGAAVTSEITGKPAPASWGLQGTTGKDGIPVFASLNLGAYSITTRNAFGVDARTYAQSGGDGGNTRTNPNVEVGGTGGTGGVGGNVTIVSSGSGVISPIAGQEPHNAITALSDGGQGGNGGNNDTSGYTAGTGGTGGVGGTVDVTNGVKLQVAGNGVAGVWAQSLGGPGGAGGSGYGTPGAGGTGGAGGLVKVANTGDIVTTDTSIGILAQSVGGYAGGGGSASRTFLQWLSGADSYGAGGGAGGAGGAVSVDLGGGKLQTGSTAVFAQSVGGSGGAGGTGATLGGTGGVGGVGGGVSVKNIAEINVTGSASASGIIAQSVGGGGGTGGAASGGIFIGGKGGTGGGGNDGGNVVVNNGGRINVSSTGQLYAANSLTPFAVGIFGQSVGGGGGVGGASSGLVQIGGDGGGGGNGGSVDIVNTGVLTHAPCNVLSACNNQSMIFAQSVGGGGGDGSVAGGLIAIGGKGGVAGDGGRVVVKNGGDLSTSGTSSYGVLAQSVGGGGGSGGGAITGGVLFGMSIGGEGGAGGNGGAVCVSGDNVAGKCSAVAADLASSSIQTRGDRSAGILAQSVGGGGGTGGGAIATSLFSSFSIGGKGGAAGKGGDVFAGAKGLITTNGAYSAGIDASSTGGGGGKGGYAISAAAGIFTTSVSLGGGGGVGNTGGNVTIDNSASITTSGSFSAALSGRSIGGGGGDAGFSVASGISMAGLDVAIGGAGGAGASAGSVSIQNLGNLATNGFASAGISALSVGGGGGSGGWAVAAGASAFANVKFTVGGDGAGGGAGGNVTVTSGSAPTSSTIKTSGDLSSGIFAASVGGSGGSGGFSVGAGASLGGTVSIAMGGKGAAGATGGAVNVTNYSTIETQGARSDGLYAQSVGGGGGDGGFAVAASAAKFATLSLSMGGGAGGGGDASNVSVSQFGSISTKGQDSEAILAQSVGGGGGNGGFSVSGAGAGIASLALSFGGEGSGGGKGANVSVSNSGASLSTMGASADGIFAQSLGGGGGNGGFSASGALTLGPSAAASLSFGGKGGGGGDSGNVSVTSRGAGSITTVGDGSRGIFAQSLGGGGGSGGFSAAFGASSFAGVGLAIGGQGAGGGTSGAVTVENDTRVSTSGANATVIEAQSIGGGGGSGGMAFSGAGGMGTVSFSNGGNAGEGADANINTGAGAKVSVKNTAALTALGADSEGILAQSIGGGGGDGGLAVAAGLSAGKVNINATFATGGKGTSGGKGGATEVINSGAIDVSGANAEGIVAQSIGGGGGKGGLSVAAKVSSSQGFSGSYTSTLGGDGGAGNASGRVDVVNSGAITTRGANSSAIVAESIGGGGGIGGGAISGEIDNSGAKAVKRTSVIGGVGGAGGFADAVFVTNNGLITTTGEESEGIVAQSIGGGGGKGGFVVAGKLSVGEGKDISNSLAALGGNAGAGEKGGSVCVVGGYNNLQTGCVARTDVSAAGSQIVTSGNGSDGVMAQSIGGGGGKGGFSVTGTLSTSTKTQASTVGGAGGSGNDSAAASVWYAGDIRTSGRNASGILAQSIGGGGGAGGFSVEGSFSSEGVTKLDKFGNQALQFIGQGDPKSGGGVGGGGGKGGDVTVSLNNLAASKGVILTSQDFSYGVLAQSIGGGGGVGAFSVSGDFTATKGGASASSVGGAGGAGNSAGSVTVTAGGSIYTGAKLEKVGTQNNPVIVASGGGVGAHAIEAQSIGGAGGNGGFAVSGGVALADGKGSSNAVGGEGGAGSDGGAVKVSTLAGARLETFGASASGILAQSIGGGGGNGAFAIGAGYSSKADDKLAQAKNIIGGNKGTTGGSGGAGGLGGAVVVDNLGAIVVHGSNANGIEAQSIGGGGGDGAFAISAMMNTLGNVSNNVGGGSGLTGGNAGKVTVTNGGSIETIGDNGIGVLAQSIGGGGGNGAFAIGAAVSTNGTAKNNVGGGDGGAGGTPDSVTVTNNGLIRTNGTNSIGILAQAIAGGGGNGGFAISASTAADVKRSYFATQQIGATGGAGGAGATVPVATIVTVANNGQITTSGPMSTAIMAQSIGGGGGNGGFAINGAIADKAQKKAAESTAVGGGGGAGGDGGIVRVTNAGSINLNGADSTGILAQSIGGGGGNGGFFGSLDMTSKRTTMTVGQTAGGNGGWGAEVSVKSTGSITSTAENSVAVLAQSIGGGGGNFGWSLDAQKKRSKGMKFAVGSDGVGLAGVGLSPLVSVEISGGNITTTGTVSHGLAAQNIAGGGGNASFSTTSPLIIEADAGETAFEQRLGASSAATDTASGADAGNTTVSNANNIKTSGAASVGFLSQAIGGGGGIIGATGDFTTVAGLGLLWDIRLGGAASSIGGKGGDVVATNIAQSVSTSGNGSIGVLSQAIGGGGGAIINDSPNFLMASNQRPDLRAADIRAQLGSEALSGVRNDSGSLKLTTGGAIVTTGDAASAVVGQVIGGGGGVFGMVVNNASQLAENDRGITVDFVLGRKGSGGGVDVSKRSNWNIDKGDILTKGIFSHGVVAQSIGGGGGLAAFVAKGALTADPEIFLGAQRSPDELTGEAMNGGAVTVTNNSLIRTTGIGAHGVIAQSIGGGGGVAQVFGLDSGKGGGFVSFGSNIPARDNQRNVVYSNGADVTVVSNNAISTTYANTVGIVAQSIGGGGGLAQIVDDKGASRGGYGSARPGAGNGGNVRVEVAQNAPINVSGAGSIGILAQSIAGGGGYWFGSTAGKPIYAGSNDGPGTSGDVLIDIKSDVSATGLGAKAIFAQSASKGLTDQNPNSQMGTGKVRIFIAPGVNVIGDGPDPSFVANPQPSVEDALHTGLGIAVQNSEEFAFTNYGTLTVVNGAKGVAIYSTAGNDSIVNYGRIIGSYVSLGGPDTFINKAFHSADNPIAHAGVFDAGAVVDLGVGGQFTNEGAFIVGGFYQGLNTNLSGNYTQTGNGACGGYGAPTTSCGYLAADVNVAGGASGRLNISGTADVSGAVVVNPIAGGSAKPGSGTATVLRAEGGLTTRGLQLQAPSSAVASYGMTTTANEINLNYTVNFGPAGLTFNQRAPASAVNAIQAAGVFPAFAPVANALFVQPNVLALGAAYNSLSGEGVSASQQTTFMANDFLHASANRQMNFWLYDQEENSGNSLTLYDDRADVTPDRKWRATASHDGRAPRFAERTWRSWMVGNGGSLSYPGQVSTGSANMSAGGYGFAGGVDRQITPNVLIGVAAGYGSYGFGVQQRQTYGNVYGGHIAGYAALRSGPFYATGVLAGDFFNNYANRTVSIAGSPTTSLFDENVYTPGVYDNLNGKFGSRSISGMGEAGYRLKMGTLDVTPFAALQFSSLKADGFNEFNGYSQSVVALNYQGRTVSSLPSYAGVQLNHNFDIGNGMPLWGWVRSAWRHEFDQLRTVTAAFMAAPGMNFTTLGAPGVRDMASVGSGVKLGLTRDLFLFAGFDGNFAPSAYSVSGSGGLQLRW